MSLDKSIEHGKEHRKPYYKKCERIDKTCRNHGSDPWMYNNRTKRNREKARRAERDIAEANHADIED